MFTLKLYKDGPLPPSGRTEIIQTTGLWINHCKGGVREIWAFKGEVGRSEYATFYVGGNLEEEPPEPDDPPRAIRSGPGGNYYGWGLLENAQGKTTEMFR